MIQGWTMEIIVTANADNKSPSSTKIDLAGINIYMLQYYPNNDN